MGHNAKRHTHESIKPYWCVSDTKTLLTATLSSLRNLCSDEIPNKWIHPLRLWYGMDILLLMIPCSLWEGRLGDRVSLYREERSIHPTKQQLKIIRPRRSLSTQPLNLATSTNYRFLTASHRHVLNVFTGLLASSSDQRVGAWKFLEKLELFAKVRGNHWSGGNSVLLPFFVAFLRFLLFL